jgi:hypothetical protein
MTVEMVFGTINSLLTLGAIYLGLLALRVARDALRLEQQARQDSQLQRRLQALDALALAVFDWENNASLAQYGRRPLELAVEARARYQVALRGCDEDLPTCQALSGEADVARVVILTQSASEEIRAKREQIRNESEGQG